MANRVNDDDVKALIDVKPGRVLTPFIDMAHLIVEEDVKPAAPTMSEARLTMIEKLLSAHFVAVTEERGGLTSSEQGESRESYAGLLTYGTGLTLTRFGQQAIVMDSSGKLAEMANAKGTKKAQFRVVGSGDQAA